MSKKTSKVIQISDIIQWYQKREIELSPKYQRNSVWNDDAKSYLIDTIIRGLPIPPIFLRQKTDVNTKTTSREIIDGQQRVRAILEYFVDEKFVIKKKFNKDYGGKKYSELDDDIKEELLEYEIFAEVITEKDESIIYDMFARLNCNNYVLNTQEIRNSKYWGDFKVLAYDLTKEFRDFFLGYRILSDKECTRMKDVEIVNSLIVLAKEGIITETPAIVDRIYEKYNENFDIDGRISNNVIKTMEVLKKIYNYFNGNLSCFVNKNYFYTLYCVFFNQMFGISHLSIERNTNYSAENIDSNLQELLDNCGKFINEYDNLVIKNKKNINISSDWVDFIANHSKRTTNKSEREQRVIFLNNYFINGKL